LVSRKHLPLFLVLLSLLATAVVAASSPIVHAQSPSVDVHVYPSSVTPNDLIFIQANVTSTIEIKNVTMFYRIGPEGLQLSSRSDYNSTLMTHVIQKAEWGLYEYQFKDKLTANTNVYLFVEATNVLGDASSWPGNIPQASTPWIVRVRNPDQSYLSSLIVTINSFDLGAKLQRVNITVDAGAYIPHFPGDSWIQATVYSGNYFAFSVILFEMGTRFFYQGKASGWATLTNGHIETAPFDNYTLSLRIDLQYQIMNLTESVNSVPIFFGTMELWNSWNVSPFPSSISWVQNSTSVLVQAAITRNGVTGFTLTYPPLALLLTGFGVLGVMPLIAKYHEEKRFDVYLSVIVLAASAELSQNIFVPAGVLFLNVFTISFAYLLFFSVLMIALSGFAPFTKEWLKLPKGIPIESYATLVIAGVITALTYNWAIPTYAKALSVVAIASGGVVLVVPSLAKWPAHKIPSFLRITRRKWHAIIHPRSSSPRPRKPKKRKSSRHG